MFNSVTIGQQHFKRQFKIVWMITTSKMLLLMLILNILTSASTLSDNDISNLNAIETHRTSVNGTKAESRQYPPFNVFMMRPPAAPLSPPGCPLCDSSVYSYCLHKLIHDTCCCNFSGAAVYKRPLQCAYNDCKLLYAKSCYEHALIKNCCCNNPY